MKKLLIVLFSILCLTSVAYADLRVSGNVYSTPNNTYTIGTASNYFLTGFISTVNCSSVNATQGYYQNGVSINTTGTMTNVAYKAQDNNFTAAQTIATINALGTNPGLISYIGSNSASDGYPIRTRYYNGSIQIGEISFQESGDPAPHQGLIIIRPYYNGVVATAAMVISAGPTNGTQFTMGNLYNNTTGSAANVFVDTDGSLYRSTSSLRYKKNIRSLDIDTTKIYSLIPKSFNMTRNDVTGNGFIAEEVNDVIPEAVAHNTITGECDGIDFNVLTTILIAEIKKLNSRIEALEEK